MRNVRSKKEFTEIYKQHTKVKEKSGVITFEHIFKHDLAKYFFKCFILILINQLEGRKIKILKDTSWKCTFCLQF